jgi:hypothetical protein
MGFNPKLPHKQVVQSNGPTYVVQNGVEYFLDGRVRGEAPDKPKPDKPKEDVAPTVATVPKPDPAAPDVKKKAGRPPKKGGK